MEYYDDEDDQKGAWTEDEDVELSRLQRKHGNRWAAVSDEIPGRTGQQCAQRWRHKVNPDIRKDKWAEAEDAQLQALFALHGQRWADIARHMVGRTDQQCMGRWRRHLDPSIKREQWSTREDRKLTELHVRFASNWSAISKVMGNRTAQQCRARWFQAHFTGKRYLDEHGDLLTPRSADTAEAGVEFAKALAAAAGKTLRPNGVSAAAERGVSPPASAADADADAKKPAAGSRKRKFAAALAAAADHQGDGGSGGPVTAKIARVSGAPLQRDGNGRFVPKGPSGAAADTAAAAEGTTTLLWTPMPSPGNIITRTYRQIAGSSSAPPALLTKSAPPSELCSGGGLTRAVSLPLDVLFDAIDCVGGHEDGFEGEDENTEVGEVGEEAVEEVGFSAIVPSQAALTKSIGFVALTIPGSGGAALEMPPPCSPAGGLLSFFRPTSAAPPSSARPIRESSAGSSLRAFFAPPPHIRTHAIAAEGAAHAHAATPPAAAAMAVSSPGCQSGSILATFNSGDWGALLSQHDFASVAAACLGSIDDVIMPLSPLGNGVSVFARRAASSRTLSLFGGGGGAVIGGGNNGCGVGAGGTSGGTGGGDAVVTLTAPELTAAPAAFVTTH